MPQRRPALLTLNDFEAHIEWVVLEDLFNFLGGYMVPRDVRAVPVIPIEDQVSSRGLHVFKIHNGHVLWQQANTGPKINGGRSAWGRTVPD
jgi:hypothetical protein